MNGRYENTRKRNLKEIESKRESQREIDRESFENENSEKRKKD